MRRLYLRIYFAVLASLAAFALAAGLAWHFFLGGRDDHARAAILAQNVLPPASAAAAEQQAALARLARGLAVDLSLFSPERRPVASIGAALPAPQRPGWQRRAGGGTGWAIQLEDGRWLAARVHRERRGPPPGVFVLALLLIAIGVGAYPVVRRLTRRLERLQSSVDALGAGQLSARVKVEGRDEVARLAESFNRAAVRIEALVGAHKSLLANASHELRTPLARIRMAVELLREGADARRKRELEQDIAELDALIDEILLASRLDAAPPLEELEALDLLALAAEEAARYDIEAAGESASVHGDPRLLRRMVRNLLENARRHGAAPITLAVRRVNNEVELEVCDGGPGVAEADRERIFEPFYRRARGAGLGLSIVRQIARRHRGEARCEGRCFVVTLAV